MLRKFAAALSDGFLLLSRCLFLFVNLDCDRLLTTMIGLNFILTTSCQESVVIEVTELFPSAPCAELV